MAQKQRKKKNKFLPMIVLAVLLAALVIGTSLLSAANARKAAEEAEKLAAENASIMLAQYDAASTSSLSYSRNGDDFLTFNAVNGAWVYEEDPNFPLNQQIVSSMASALSSMICFLSRMVSVGTNSVQCSKSTPSTLKNVGATPLIKPPPA